MYSSFCYVFVNHFESKFFEAEDSIFVCDINVISGAISNFNCKPRCFGVSFSLAILDRIG